jgi:hypothetical protein
MADPGIVQKVEIAIVYPQCRRLRRKRECELTLLSDCLRSSRTPK